MKLKYVFVQGELPDEQFLKELGFTDQRAKYITKRFKVFPDLHNHISILDFAHIFIRDLFKYDLLLTDEISSLPRQRESINVEYSVQSEVTKNPIVCQNFKESQTLNRKLRNFLSVGSEKQGSARDGNGTEYYYWYHGTNCSFASDIVKFGIDIEKGKERRDFSDGNGFYLSDDLHRAKQWSLKMCIVGNFSAVLRYKIPKASLKDNGIVLSRSPDDLEDWKNIVRYCRSGKKKALQMKKRSEKLHSSSSDR